MSKFNVLNIKITKIKIFMFQLRSVPYLHYASNMLRREEKKKKSALYKSLRSRRRINRIVLAYKRVQWQLLWTHK